MRGSVLVEFISLATRGTIMDCQFSKQEEVDTPVTVSGDEITQISNEAEAATTASTDEAFPITSCIEEPISTELLPNDFTSSNGEPTPTNSSNNEEPILNDYFTNEETSIASGSSTIEDEKRAPRLSGAARKRMKWLLQQGLDREVARDIALKPIDYSDLRLLKRPSSSMPEDESRSKRRATTNKISSSHLITKDDQPGSIKVGILHQKYPESNLSTEEMKSIQEAILLSIFDLDNGSVKPKFLGNHFMAGWLLVICANKDTAEWLKGTIPNLKPWEGAELRLDETDLDKAILVNAYFPNCKEEKTERILKFLQGQNAGLLTQNWRVLNRVEDEKAKTTYIRMLVDPSSYAVLKLQDFQASFKFSKVTIKPKRPSTPSTSSERKYSEAVSTTSNWRRNTFRKPMRESFTPSQRSTREFIRPWQDTPGSSYQSQQRDVRFPVQTRYISSVKPSLQYHGPSGPSRGGKW